MKFVHESSEAKKRNKSVSFGEAEEGIIYRYIERIGYESSSMVGSVCGHNRYAAGPSHGHQENRRNEVLNGGSGEVQQVNPCPLKCGQVGTSPCSQGELSHSWEPHQAGRGSRREEDEERRVEGRVWNVLP